MSITSAAWTIASPPLPQSPQTPNLVKSTISVPSPGPKQVLVRIQAVSLNYRDLLVATHSPAYPLIHKTNLVPVCDAAGEIKTAGEGSQWAGKEGQKVVVHPNSWIDGDVRNFKLNEVMGAAETEGTLREWVVLDDNRVVAAPKNLTVEETATLVTAGVTALNMLLYGPQRLEKGDWILTQGTGGVSVFGIQIAVALGATVIATSSSDEKLEFAKKLGAKHLINYKKTPDWDEEVLKITGGKGVDHVVEVGGSATIAKSLNSARLGGLVTVAGILTESEPADLVPSILFGAKTVRGTLGVSREMIAKFVEIIEEHDIHPVIAKTYEFDEAPTAFEHLKSQTAVGKIVIKTV